MAVGQRQDGTGEVPSSIVSALFRNPRSCRPFRRSRGEKLMRLPQNTRQAVTPVLYRLTRGSSHTFVCSETRIGRMGKVRHRFIDMDLSCRKRFLPETPK